MSLRYLIPIVVAAVLPLLLLLGFSGDEGVYQLYVPRGYINEVNRLIAEEKLIYDCTTQLIKEQNLTDAERFFLRNSYLRRDLARWSSGDRTPFVVEREELRGGGCEGELQRVSESFHNQRLPNYKATSWRGRLFVRQRLSSISLSTPQRSFELARTPWRRLPLPANAFEDIWLNQSDDVRSERMALKLLESGRMFASLEHVGDQAAVEVFNERPKVSLNGCRISRGWRVRLDHDDRLRFQQDNRSLDQRFQVEVGGTGGLISLVNEVNGEDRRKTFSNRLAMAKDLTRAIDAAVIRGVPEGGRDDFDVYLTLDTFFQDLLDDHLGEFCRTQYDRRPLRAGVALLAADTGRVLALASYPRPGDLERMALKRPVDATILERNHNFMQHPVGSAAKPFLAAAALATQPRLAQLTLPCFPGGEPPKEFLGYDFGRYNLPPDCIGEVGTINFRRFLELSSNRYMLALGLLAMADWQDGSPKASRDAPGLPALDQFRIAGRTYSRRPYLDIVKDESRPGQTELADLQALGFFQNFRDLFGHSIHYQTGPIASALELNAWTPVLTVAGSVGDATTARSLVPVTSEKVNLRVNLIQQLRQDFYTTMLGLGNNRWSNLTLAESMARLVTGRAVDAAFVERVETPSAESSEQLSEVHWDLEANLQQAPPQALQALSEDGRRLILQGMEDVVTAGAGTATTQVGEVVRKLNRRAPAEVTYRVVAKTGTPSTDLGIVERGPAEIGPGAIEVYSRREQVKDGVLVLALSREDATNDSVESLALAFFIEAQGGSEQATALAAELLPPLIEAYWPEDWLEQRTDSGP